MKKFACVITAVCAIAVAAPSVANAEKIVIERGGHHHDRYRDHGWHHHGHDRVVVKHRD